MAIEIFANVGVEANDIIQRYYKKLGVPKDIQQALGRVIQSIFPTVIKKLKPNEIESLQDLEYTKKTFGKNFTTPILKKSTGNSKDIENENGFTVYYKTPINGYFVSNQWVNANNPMFEDWLTKQIIHGDLAT